MPEDKELKIKREQAEAGKAGEAWRPAKIEIPRGPEIAPAEREGAEAEAGGVSEQAEAAARGEVTIPSPAAAPALAPQDQENYKKLEAILEADLADLYNSMDPNDQMKFKIKGEETARNIFQLIYYQSKIKVSKLVSLIRSWLVLIPGINKFFLEQETKIKTDKILELVDKNKKII